MELQFRLDYDAIYGLKLWAAPSRPTRRSPLRHSSGGASGVDSPDPSSTLVIVYQRRHRLRTHYCESGMEAMHARLRRRCARKVYNPPPQSPPSLLPPLLPSFTHPPPLSCFFHQLHSSLLRPPHLLAIWWGVRGIHPTLHFSPSYSSFVVAMSIGTMLVGVSTVSHSRHSFLRNQPWSTGVACTIPALCPQDGVSIHLCGLLFRMGPELGGFSPHLDDTFQAL